MNAKPELFGLFGFTHGWGRLLTVMSPQGANAVMETIGAASDVVLQRHEGKLPQFHEKRDGALDRLIEKHGVVVLDKADWDAKKAALGETIYL